MREDLTERKFGILTVLKYSHSNNKRKTSMWLCKCECGNEKIIALHDLKHGTTSCGCISRESKLKNMKKGRGHMRINDLEETHYNDNSRIAKIHKCMKSRCYNPNGGEYKNYGGRGITICNEWLGENGYINFKKWALENEYEDNLTIDRIKVNGNYKPNNCRWATNKEQQNNKRNNHIVNICGVNHTIAEWSDISGIKQNTLYYRIKRGWTGDKIIS